MYLDSSRIKDLSQLKEWMDDPVNHSRARREMYGRTFRKILRDAKDEKLGKLRERLTRATFAEDKYEMWKLTNLIKDHMKEERVDDFHGRHDV